MEGTKKLKEGISRAQRSLFKKLVKEICDCRKGGRKERSGDKGQKEPGNEGKGKGKEIGKERRG